MPIKPEPDGWMRPIHVDSEPEPEEEAQEETTWHDSYEGMEGGEAEGGIMGEGGREALERMKCPKCGQGQTMIVVGKCQIKLDKSGQCQARMEWGRDSECHCPECHWKGSYQDTQGAENG